jgi:Autophagy protein ATG9
LDAAHSREVAQHHYEHHQNEILYFQNQPDSSNSDHLPSPVVGQEASREHFPQVVNRQSPLVPSTPDTRGYSNRVSVASPGHAGIPSNGGRSTGQVIRGALQQTASEWSRFASIFYSAAADAYSEQKVRNRPPAEAFQYHHRYNNPAEPSLDEFGLPTNDRYTRFPNATPPNRSMENLYGYFGAAATDAGHHPQARHQTAPLLFGNQNRGSPAQTANSHPWWWFLYGPKSLLRKSKRERLQPPSSAPRSDFHYSPLAADLVGNDDEADNEQLGRDDSDEFIFLPHWRWEPAKDGWGAAGNLDVFFTRLYNYFYHRGFTAMCAVGIVNQVTLWFTLWWSIVLISYVDWVKLSNCVDEHSCEADFFDAYIHKSPLRTHGAFGNFLVVLYVLLFGAYGLFSAWSFYQSMVDAAEARFIFEERLGISARKLSGGAVDWDRDVVQRLRQLQESGEYRVAIHDGAEVDALLIAQRILRKENFMVAFFNRKLLNLQVPFFGSESFFCSSIEVSLKPSHKLEL